MTVSKSGSSAAEEASGITLKAIVLTGLCSGASAAVGFVLIAVPNIEMITAAVFLSGMLLGRLRGMIVGITAEFIFAGLNPMGMSFPPLMAAQVASMALTGFAGGIISPLVRAARPVTKALILGAAGFILTLNYDIWTTLSFPLSAGFDRVQTLTTLKLGIPFAILHLAGNIIIFALALPLAYANLRRLVPAMAAACLILSAVSPLRSYAQEAVFNSGSAEWEYMYYEDMGDIISAIPGFYHYDLALLGQPVYMFQEGKSPRLFINGVPMNSRLTGMVDFTLFPPGYIDSVEVKPFYSDGFISGNGLVKCSPRRYDFEVPYSRVNYRDGYYGLGAADFILAQRLRSNLGFQVGGRISENSGYLTNSALDGVQLRTGMNWKRDDGWNLGIAFLNNRNKAEITFTNDKRILQRSDIFFSADKSQAGEGIKAVLHYCSSKEEYRDRLEPEESVLDFLITGSYGIAGMKFKPALYLDYSEIELGSVFSEKRSRAAGSAALEQTVAGKLTLVESASIEISREVLAGAGLTGLFPIGEESRAGFSVVHSANSPSPLHRAYDYQASDIFLPGSELWRLSPGSEITASDNLDPERVSAFRLFGSLKILKLLSFKPSLLYKYLHNPIDLFPTGTGSGYRWENADAREFPAAEAELEAGRWRGFRFKGALTYQYPDERRDFIPDMWGLWRLDYQKRAFDEQLQYTIDLHCRYYGAREGMMSGVYYSLPDDFVLGARVTLQVGDFMLFWGNENFLSREYELIPGCRMIHREEVWGVNWVFWN